MDELVGGLRARLVRDSCALAIEAALGDLGWFDTGRAHQPVRFQHEPLRRDQAIEPNLVICTIHHVTDDQIELGSVLSTAQSSLVVDVFAESESLGEHLMGDVRDLLRGRIARTTATIPILDLRQATPVAIGYVEVFDVTGARQWATAEAEWERRWFRVEALVDDTYLGEEIVP